MAQMIPLLAGLGGTGAAAGTLGTLGQIATIAGPIVGVASAVAQNKEARAQGAEHTREAREARVHASVEAARQRRESRIRQSADRTAYMESGAYSGTASDVLMSNAAAFELDALTTEYQGEQAGRSADFAAQQARRSASPLRVFSAAIRGVSQIDPLNLAPYGGAGSGVYS